MEAALAIPALSNGRWRDEEEEEQIRADARKRAGSAAEVVRQTEEPKGQIFVSVGRVRSYFLFLQEQIKGIIIIRQRYEDQQSSH